MSIKTIEGQKYLKVEDKWVPLFETIEELEQHREREVH